MKIYQIIIISIILILNVCDTQAKQPLKSDFDNATEIITSLKECGSKSNGITYLKCLSEQRDASIFTSKLLRNSNNVNKSIIAVECFSASAEDWDYKSIIWAREIKLMKTHADTMSGRPPLPEKPNHFHLSTKIKECIVYHQNELK